MKSNNPKRELKHIIYLDANNLYCYSLPKFLQTCGFTWIDPTEFDFNKFNSNGSSSKQCVLEVNLEYSKELRKLQNDYLLVIGVGGNYPPSPHPTPPPPPAPFPWLKSEILN